uniref:hypothetical protein n=1 Tax=Agathobacter sp. TaxID=2021311 RepID=UPI00405686F2
MRDKEDNRYIEAIKLAAGSVQYKDLSVKETFMEAVSQLHRYYKDSQNTKYLETAVLHIQAYLEMGFSYEEGKTIYDKILKDLGTTKEDKFPRKFYAAKKIKLNKTQVKSMIKKWPASPHQTMKIAEVVEDIIEKVERKEVGIYYYKCAVTEDMYELVISEKEIFFHDLRRGIFYTFEG